MKLTTSQSYELMKMSIRNFNDKKILSSEAYFSNTTSLETALFEFVNDLEMIYKDYIGHNLSHSNKSIANKNKDIILNIIHKHEQNIAKAVNAQSVTMGLIFGVGAACYPLMWDDQIINTKKAEKLHYNKLDKEFVISLEDVMETKDGFKFKDKENKHLIFILGFGLFDMGLTVEEIVASILHEYGHCIQQMLININTQLYCYYKTELINQTVDFFEDALNFFHLINPIYWLKILFIKIPKFLILQVKKVQLKFLESKNTEEELGEILGPNLLDDIKRNKIIEDAKATTEYTSKKIVKPKKWSKFILFKYGSMIVAWFIQSVFSLGWVLFMPFRHIFDYKALIIFANKSYINQELRYEQFADYVSRSYGYSSHLSSALIKLRKISKENGKDLQLFNFLYLVPGLNMLITLSNYLDAKNSALLAGYPLTIERIEDMYKSLEYELNHNPKLTQNDKISIQNDMNELKNVYKAAKNHKGIQGFIMSLYYKITRKSIENTNRTSVIDNVVEPFLQLEKELEIDKIDNPAQKDQLIMQHSNESYNLYLNENKESLKSIEELLNNE